jgi:hypothetical protein
MNQPLKGIKLNISKVVNKQDGRDTYTLTIGRATVTNTLFYVTTLKGQVIDSRKKLDTEAKKWWGIS